MIQCLCMTLTSVMWITFMYPLMTALNMNTKLSACSVIVCCFKAYHGMHSYGLHAYS